MRRKVPKGSKRHVPFRNPAAPVHPIMVHYVTGHNLAGEALRPASSGNRAVEPSRDSTVVATGVFRSMNDGRGLALPALDMT